jgi:hypothetical protein
MRTVDISAAAHLLDLGARIGGGPRAQAQLEGAVAIHNLLARQRVAYLADEVGMGKTYVALGAFALMRHHNPRARLLVIAPRENIQHKWKKELANFARHNLRFPDLRVTALDRRPARPLALCDNLLDWAHEAVVDPDRDFFLRLTSFSLPLREDRATWRTLRERMRRQLPWLRDEVFASQAKEAFKENFARALCCALPVFDLVIVDEAHNLKHGRWPGVSARNRALSLAFGHPDDEVDPALFPNYGPRARNVLFLSATPLEGHYRDLWHQLDVFGVGKPFAALVGDDLDDLGKREVASRFLVRRVTELRAGGATYTKNQYRREWRSGGVANFDDPIRVVDDRQRLIVALVQKKVSELLRLGRLKASFQIGMLASFESFLETTGTRTADDASVFDDAEQAADAAERDGLDVRDVNRLARRYREAFQEEMPHPKMDALVARLATAWCTGEKALVFVRRRASVSELKRKLDHAYDRWLLADLRARLPTDVLPQFAGVVARYEDDRRRGASAGEPGADDDRGGSDTFFAWFFRGKGPAGVLSGASLRDRFNQGGAVLGTLFLDNYVMDLLDVPAGGLADALGRALGWDLDTLAQRLGSRAAAYLGAGHSADRMQAVQAAALELLKERDDLIGRRARALWQLHFQPVTRAATARDVSDALRWLERPTFFSELRRPHRVALRAALWPDGGLPDDHEELLQAYRERGLRAQLLTSAARLGHSLIDLYVLVIRRLGSLDPGAHATDDDSGTVDDLLDLLAEQQATPHASRGWGAFDELAAIAANFALIVDVNAHDLETLPVGAVAKALGQWLGEQQPVGGMSGQANHRMIKQFRMPGYPLILISTDVLQEGEDLHTFCSSVYHYGLAWTSSSTEQRVGRIDRVRSQTDRRLTACAAEPDGEALLQVFFPHLQDTVEVLQVRKVLERLNRFLELMHTDLAPGGGEQRRIDVDREFTRGGGHVAAIRGPLRSAFPLPAGSLSGTITALAVSPEFAATACARFDGLPRCELPGVRAEWEPEHPPGALLGTVRLASGRVQPFTLQLRSLGETLIVRCISPVGRVYERGPDSIVETSQRMGWHLGVVAAGRDSSYDLTVEDDVALADPSSDAARLGLLLARVADAADRLEQAHLPGHDAPLAAFDRQLRTENHHED